MARKAFFVTFLMTILAIGFSPLIASHCPWDLNGDDMVGDADLDILLACWGCNVGGVCVFADFDHDGCVGPTDLLEMLNNWGKCPAE